MWYQDAAFERAMQAAYRGDWDTVIDECQCVYEIIERVVLETRDLMPDKARYELPLSVYDHHGDRIPEIVDMVREAGQYKSESEKFLLPEELRGLDEIEIYRGTLVNPVVPTYGADEAISWTTDHRVACFFAYRAWDLSGRLDAMRASGLGFYDYADFEGDGLIPVVLAAKIATSDVIGYLSERDESEVLQYRSARDIHVEWSPHDGATDFDERFMAEIEEYKNQQNRR